MAYTKVMINKADTDKMSGTVGDGKRLRTLYLKKKTRNVIVITRFPQKVFAPLSSCINLSIPFYAQHYSFQILNLLDRLKTQRFER